MNKSVRCKLPAGIQLHFSSETYYCVYKGVQMIEQQRNDEDKLIDERVCIVIINRGILS